MAGPTDRPHNVSLTILTCTNMYPLTISRLLLSISLEASMLAISNRAEDSIGDGNCGSMEGRGDRGRC